MTSQIAPTTIDPDVPAGRQVVQSYGAGRFRISDVVIDGSALVFPDRAAAWDVRDASTITLDSLQEVLSAEPAIDVLFIGCGDVYVDEPPSLRASLRERGIVLEWMDTAPACRTWNVVVADDRRIALALIAMV